jgi:LysM repeat protein
MTISRSRGTHLAVVALALSLPAAPLASQQPPPPSNPAPQAPSQTLAAPPATHVVQQGETLWGLAKQFLGDPLLWPEIYRLNTTVIEDPHWIFPGEELRFTPGAELAVGPAAAPGAAPAESAAAQPQAGPPAPGEITVAPTPTDTSAPTPQASPSGNPFDGPTIFANKSNVQRQANTLRLQSQQAYRTVRAGEHYSSGFLTEGEQLDAGQILGNTRTASITRLTATTSATLFSEVAVVPPSGEALKVGDLLLAYAVPRSIAQWGEVVRPTGLLKVTGIGDASGNATAQVIGVYQAITSGQLCMKVPAFSPSKGRSVAVDSGLVGSVIDMRDPHELLAFQDVLFIDRGAEDGVHLGDTFQISGTTTAASGIGEVVQNEAKVLIVYLRPHSATGVVIQMDRPDIRPGATARQIRRMPS